MTIFIVFEYSYDYYEFEQYIGSFDTKQKALDFVSDKVGNYMAVTDCVNIHLKMSYDSENHFYVMEDSVN